MDPSTAAMVFESFPFLKTMPDYQAFLKSDDSTDPDKVGARLWVPRSGGSSKASATSFGP